MAELVQGARLRYTLTPQLAIVSWSRKGRGFESHSYHSLTFFFAHLSFDERLFLVQFGVLGVLAETVLKFLQGCAFCRGKQTIKLRSIKLGYE